MATYKRGSVYWYEFILNKERIRCSTKQGNLRVARQMEAAHRTRLAQGHVGIIRPRAVPSLRDFAPRFVATMEVHCQGKPRTLKFWKEKLYRLLEFEPLASSPLDKIGPALIAEYVQSATRRKVLSSAHRSREGRDMSELPQDRPRRNRKIRSKSSITSTERVVTPATVNRELATLRRLLRLAHEWSVIPGVPRIRMLRGERNREFVLSHQEEFIYLSALPQPLADVALLILDTGLRVGEALALKWADIHIEPAHGGRYGYLRVREGKSKNARRNLSLSDRVSRMLASRKLLTHSKFVFPGEGDKAFCVTSLCHQHSRVRAALNLPRDFVIHSLRHTMLTRLGEAGADSFTIKRIAGHSSVTVSERYVHPTPEGLERAFERLETFNGAAFDGLQESRIGPREMDASLSAKTRPSNHEVPTVSTTVN